MRGGGTPGTPYAGSATVNSKLYRVYKEHVLKHNN